MKETVTQLRAKNASLEEQVQALSKELKESKDLYNYRGENITELNDEIGRCQDLLDNVAEAGPRRDPGGYREVAVSVRLAKWAFTKAFGPVISSKTGTETEVHGK